MIRILPPALGLHHFEQSFFDLPGPLSIQNFPDCIRIVSRNCPGSLPPALPTLPHHVFSTFPPSPPFPRPPYPAFVGLHDCIIRPVFDIGRINPFRSPILMYRCYSNQSNNLLVPDHNHDLWLAQASVLTRGYRIYSLGRDCLRIYTRLVESPA